MFQNKILDNAVIFIGIMLFFVAPIVAWFVSVEYYDVYGYEGVFDFMLKGGLKLFYLVEIKYG